MLKFITFEKLLKERKEFEFNISYVIPGVKGYINEKYRFKKIKEKILSYEEDIEVFRTDTIRHMYFVYRKLFHFHKVNGRIIKNKKF